MPTVAPGVPNGRRLWPFWLVRAATGNVRDAKARRLYPAKDRWIGLIVSKARHIGEPDGEPLPAQLGVLCASCNARRGLGERRR